jgi:hypothetical protein
MSRRLRLALLSAIGMSLVLLTASAGAGIRASTSAVRVETAAARFPLSVRQATFREVGGRIVGATTIVNTGDTSIRPTTGVLALADGSGAGAGATGILTFPLPALPPGHSKRVRLATGPLRALPLRPGTHGILICSDIYGRIQRFAQTRNCSLAGKLALSTDDRPTSSRGTPNTRITTGVASISGSSSGVFRFVSTVTQRTFQCRLDGAPWLACSSPQRYIALPDGRHSFDVRAVSPGGSADPTPAHESWTVNTLAPAVRLTSPESGSTTDDHHPRLSGAAGTAPGDASTVTVKVFSGSSTSGSPVQTRAATVSGRGWSVAPAEALADGTYTARAEQANSTGLTGVSNPRTFAIQSASSRDDSGLARDSSPPSPAPDPTPTSAYSIGGTVSGLSGTVILQGNGSDELSLSSNGPFAFGTQLATGAAYDVTVKTNPSGQACTTSNAVGTVASSNITDITITCAPPSTTKSAADDFNRPDGGLGVDWEPMSDGGLSIAAHDAQGTTAAIAGDIRVGESYGSDQSSQIEVTSSPLAVGDWVGPAVRSQNGGQSAYVGLYWNDQDTGAYVLQLYVRQSGNWVQLGSTYTLPDALPAGTQLTLSATGSSISFQENGVERIAVADSSLTGGAPGIMTYGAATADNWAATEATTSASTTYGVGGTVSGLSGTMVLQNNGRDDLSVSSDGAFAFGTRLAPGTAYNVTVKSDPSGQTCTASGAAGTIASADMTSVTVTCEATTPPPPPVPLDIHYAGTDSNGVASYDFTSSDDGYGTHVLRVLAPTNPAPGVPHNFLYVLPTESEGQTAYGDGIETLRRLDAQDKYDLTIVEPSFPTEPWYADNPKDPSLRYETFLTKDLVPWVTENLGVPAASEPLGTLAGQEQNWLIGFSKSGIGGQDLLLKHPDVFSVAASWDFPADMTSYGQYGSSSANQYGTDANFQANYRLTRSFLDAHKAPFLSKNRIWIGGYNAFQTDMTDYDGLLTSEGIAHTTETPTPVAHRWDSGWVPIALDALSQDGAALDVTL